MVAEEPGTIADDLVVTKYKMAAEITNSKYNLFAILQPRFSRLRLSLTQMLLFRDEIC